MEDTGADAATEATGAGVALPIKRKRGRPPKDPKKIAALQAAAAAEAAAAAAGAAGDGPPDNHQQGPATEAAAAAAQKQAAKPRRGRPPGSQAKTASAASPARRTAGAAATRSKSAGAMQAQVLSIQAGEDVYRRVLELSQSQNCSLVVLAGNGSLSSATLMQLNEQGEGVGVTLDGHFTIVSIGGSVLQSAAIPRGHARVPTTQFLSTSIANPSGGVVGGMVAGPLIAAGPVLLVVGVFSPAGIGAAASGPAATNPLELLGAAALPSPAHEAAAAATATAAAAAAGTADGKADAVKQGGDKEGKEEKEEEEEEEGAAEQQEGGNAANAAAKEAADPEAEAIEEDPAKS